MVKLTCCTNLEEPAPEYMSGEIVVYIDFTKQDLRFSIEKSHNLVDGAVFGVTL